MATAVAVVSSVVWSRRPGALRCLFLGALGAWAVVTAVYYDLVVVPALTS